MEKCNQLPKTEGCLAEGEPVDLRYYRVEQPLRSVPRETREPQAGPASCLSNSASKVLAASGDGVCLSEPNTERPAPGEGLESLPGSKSVARAEERCARERSRTDPRSPRTAPPHELREPSGYAASTTRRSGRGSPGSRI